MKALIKIGGTLLDDATSRHDLARQIAAIAASGVHRHCRARRRQADDALPRRARHQEPLRARPARHDRRNHRRRPESPRRQREHATGRGARSRRARAPSDSPASIPASPSPNSSIPNSASSGRVTSSDPGAARTRSRPPATCRSSPAWRAARTAQVYNVNGDSMAVAVASAWKADRLRLPHGRAGRPRCSKTILPRAHRRRLP